MYTLCHYELWRCYELSIEDELQLYLTNSDSSLSSGIPPPSSGRSTVETPPAYPPPLPSSRITSSVSTTYAVQSNHLQCIHHHGPSLLELIHHHFAVARGMCIFPWSLLSARNSSVSLHGVGGVLVVGLSMHQPLTFCYWLMDEVCCEAFLGNANRTVAVHVLCLLLTLVMR